MGRLFFHRSVTFTPLRPPCRHYPPVATNTKNIISVGIIIGIDVGISTTKIVGINDGNIISPIRIKATDPVTSLYGAFGKYLHDNNIALTDVDHVMLTGVGSAYIQGNVYGRPTEVTDEFTADALGARYACDLDRMIVVSMGTGTTFVKYDNHDISHIAGIAMGGGTLAGLARLLLGTDDIQHILSLAEKGNIANIDLVIGDICKNEIPGLPPFATASLFGKAQATTPKEDIALGLICTVIQTIGSATILAAKGTVIKDFVMIGNLTLLPQTRVVFSMLEQLYGVRFHIPKHSEFSTAIGAAMSYIKKQA